MSTVKVDRIEDLGGMYGFETKEVLNVFPRSLSTAPTKMADGSPLVFGTKYFNSTEQIEYIYRDTGWVSNDVNQLVQAKIDSMATTTPTANKVVRAGSNAKIDIGWLPFVPSSRDDLANTEYGKGSSLVAFRQNWPDAIDQTAYRKLSQTVHASDFGEIGDWRAIQKAADYLNSIGGGTLGVASAIWTFPNVSTLKLYSNIRLIGSGGAVFDFSNRTGGNSSIYKFLVEARGTFEPGIPVTIDVSKGSIVINTNTTLLSEGDLVILTSDETELGDTTPVKVGEYLIVDEIVSPTKFRANNSTFSSYSAASNARIHKVNPVENVHIENIIFKGQGRLDPAEGDQGLGFIYGKHIRVRNCKFDKIDMTQLEFRSCYDFRVDGCYFYHTKYTSSGHTPGESQPVAITPRGPVQYQIRVADCCQYGVISNCVGDGSRHFFNTGHSYRKEDGSSGQQVGYLFGLSRCIKIIDCNAKNTWHACYSTHNDSEFIEFIDCVAENSGMAGFNPRHRNIVMSGCISRNCNTHFLLTTRPTNILIENCKTYGGGNVLSMPDGIQDVGGVIHIDGCKFYDSANGVNIVSPVGNRGKLYITNTRVFNAVPATSGNSRPIRVEGSWDFVYIKDVTVDGTAAAQCIYVNSTCPLVIVNSCDVMNGLRNVEIGALVTRGIIINCLSLGMTVNTDFQNKSTNPTNQNNVA